MCLAIIALRGAITDYPLPRATLCRSFNSRKRGATRGLVYTARPFLFRVFGSFYGNTPTGNPYRRARSRTIKKFGAALGLGADGNYVAQCHRDFFYCPIRARAPCSTQFYFSGHYGAHQSRHWSWCGYFLRGSTCDWRG